MDAKQTIEAYYEALRNSDSLVPFFELTESTVKFGIAEHLFGGDAVESALEEQTSTTTDWSVTSQNLNVEEFSTFAMFADEVALAWTDTLTGSRYSFSSRWSGVLIPTDSGEDGWKFISMHVSAPRSL